jgi:hypothetical protein
MRKSSMDEVFLTLTGHRAEDEASAGADEDGSSDTNKGRAAR